MALPHRRLQLIEPSASPEEAAAIVAALERFMRDTAATTPASQAVDEWLQAARLEAVELVWPRPVVVAPGPAAPSAWRWSGRWWGPLTEVSGRQRPWR